MQLAELLPEEAFPGPPAAGPVGAVPPEAVPPGTVPPGELPPGAAPLEAVPPGEFWTGAGSSPALHASTQPGRPVRHVCLAMRCMLRHPDSQAFTSARIAFERHCSLHSCDAGRASCMHSLT